MSCQSSDYGDTIYKKGILSFTYVVVVVDLDISHHKIRGIQSRLSLIF